MVSHRAHSCPALVRRCFIGGVTLGTVFWVSSHQPPSLLMGVVLFTQIALASVLCGQRQPAGAGLLSQSSQPEWQWQQGNAKARAVSVKIEIDLGWLLCLRLTPLFIANRPAPARSAGRGSGPTSWVWLKATDPKNWLELRWRLNSPE